MFERYGEAACKALFFARVHTSVRRGDTIDTVDLLQGILTVSFDDVSRLAPVPDAVTALVAPALRRRDGEVEEEFAERIFLHGMLDRDTSREVPFDATAKAALESAASEADALGHTEIRPAHLLLGILRHEGTPAWQGLMDAGVTLHGVRAVLARGADGR